MEIKQIQNQPSKLSEVCGRVISNSKLQDAIFLLIVINSIMLAISTSDFVTTNERIRIIYDRIDKVFLIIFTFELLLHFMHKKREIFLDNWLTFDFILIGMSWLCSTLTVFRVFRVLRGPLRVLRVTTHLSSLKALINAMLRIIPSVLSIMTILLLIFYVYAVMFTELFKSMKDDGTIDGDYFTRIDKTFFTLFIIMTLDGWSDIALQVIEVYPWSWLLFISFISITSFTILNLLVGVSVDAVMSTQIEEEKERARISIAIETKYSNIAQEEARRERLEIKAEVSSLRERLEYMLNHFEKNNVSGN